MTGAPEAATAGHIAGGLDTNRSHMKEWIADKTTEEERLEIVYDPQTSGGLLISIPGRAAPVLEEALASQGVPVYPVGRVVEGLAGEVVLK